MVTFVIGNIGNGDVSQMRVGRSQNGAFDRMGRAVYKSLQTAYLECLKATDGIRFKRNPLTAIPNSAEPKFSPSLDQMIQSSLNLAEL